MKRLPVLGLLVFAAAALACVAWWALSDDRAGPGTDVPAGDGTDAPAGDAAAKPRAGGAKPRGRARVQPVESAPVVPATGDAAWDAARREAAAGRFLEALEVALPARRKGDPAWKAADRVEEMLRWEDAALDAFEGAMGRSDPKDLLAWLRRLDAAIRDPARRKRLDVLRRRLVEEGKLDLRSILDAASPESRVLLQRHLRRFGGGAGGDAGATEEPTRTDELLRALRARNEARPAAVAPLPVDDDAAREQRRLEQLEQLRQRSSEGLLEPIAAGLAWLALHQSDTGEISDDVVAQRCTYLGHALCTAQGAAPKGQYGLAATGLAVLGWLDFRDQDLAQVFEPSLSLGVSWLRSQMRKDGSFPRAGYEGAIALMALGQAARASGRSDLAADAARGLRYVASKQSADGGYRYQWGAAGDLSVTGWFAQAWEQSPLRGDASLAPFEAKLKTFVTSVRRGESGFAYTADQKGASGSLGGVGMLSLQIVDPDEAAKRADAWSKTLADLAVARRRPDLYTVYYEVRTELALQGSLSPARQQLLLDLPRDLQRTDPSAAGMFGESANESAAPEKKSRPPAWQGTGWPGRGGRAVATAFAVLTMEHALYRR